MPNHVTHNMTITGPQEILEEIFSCHMDDEGLLIFQSIIPRPAALDIPAMGGRDINVAKELLSTADDKEELFTAVMNSESRKSMALKAVLKNNVELSNLLLKTHNYEQFQETFNTAKSQLENQEKYGESDWYNWSISNWGTKWPAYSGGADLQKDCIEGNFYTAWSPPKPIFRELTDLYPEIEMRVAFIDEGYGFAGEQIWSKGDLFEENDFSQDHLIEEFARDEFGHTTYEEED